MAPDLVHSNVESESSEPAVDLTEVMVVLENETDFIEKKQTRKSKKIAFALIGYGLAILLLSLNISSNVLLATTHSTDQKNHTENNYTLCSIDELSRLVILTCKGQSIKKIFHLGKNFDFATCAYS